MQPGNRPADRHVPWGGNVSTTRIALPRQRTSNKLERKPKRTARRTTPTPTGRLDFKSMPVLGEKERNQATSQILAILNLEAATVEKTSVDPGNVQHPNPRFRRAARAAAAYRHSGAVDDGHELKDWRALTRLGSIHLDELVAAEFA